MNVYRARKSLLEFVNKSFEVYEKRLNNFIFLNKIGNKMVAKRNWYACAYLHRTAFRAGPGSGGIAKCRASTQLALRCDDNHFLIQLFL